MFLQILAYSIEYTCTGLLSSIASLSYITTGNFGDAMMQTSFGIEFITMMKLVYDSNNFFKFFISDVIVFL